MSSSGKTDIVMTVIGFVVSTLFIVFICTRLICARIQLTAYRRHFHRRFSSGSANTLSSLERGLHGIEPPIVSNFPAKKYGDEYFAATESGQCTICLAEYHKEDIVRILPYCGHYFHRNCIDIWLLQHCTCPVCRISLREANEKKRSMQLVSSSRSQYSLESAGLHSHYCRLTRTLETHRIDPIQENPHLSPVSPENGDNIPSTGENVVGKDLINKHVESPSSA
ncbi:hypothetical protein vseg_011191 [Gypsophila vaccaria]